MNPAKIFLLGTVSASALLLSSCGNEIDKLYAQLREEFDPVRRVALVRYIDYVEDFNAGKRVNASDALRLAVILNDIDGVRRFVADGANPNISDGYESLLKIAVLRMHNFEIAEILIKESDATRAELGDLLVLSIVADVPADGENVSFGESFFKSADERRKTIEFLLKHSANENAELLGKSALCYAVAKKDIDTQIALLDYGAILDPEALFVAVREGNSEGMDLLLARGADANAKIGGVPVLFVAVEKGDVKTAKVLMNHGADVNAARSSDSFSVLACATAADNVEMARLLIERGADVNGDNFSAGTPLIGAILAKNSVLKDMLVARGAEYSNPAVLRYFVSTSNDDAVAEVLGKGAEPHVSLFALARKDSIVKKLVEAGADASYALPYYVAGKNESMVRWLLEKGADAKMMPNGVPIVEIAARNSGSDAIVKILIEAGAEAEIVIPYYIRIKDIRMLEYLCEKIKDPQAFAAFPKLIPMVAFAAQNKNPDLVKKLVEAGADPIPALAYYIGVGDDEMTEWLLAHNAKAPDEFVAIAAKAGKDDLVKKLVEAGSSPTLALPSYVDRKNEKMIRWLLEKGANANVEFSDGVPVIAVAARNPDGAIVKILVDAGAKPTPALLAYVKTGNLEQVEKLLAVGANANAEFSDGVPVVAFAAQRRSVDILKKLVDFGGNASAALPFYLESRQPQDLQILDFLLERGADARMYVQGVPAVVRAAMARNPEAVRRLVSARGNATFSLPWFAEKNQLETAEFLLKNGANPNMIAGVVPVKYFVSEKSASSEKTAAEPANSASETSSSR